MASFGSVGFECILVEVQYCRIFRYRGNGDYLTADVKTVSGFNLMLCLCSG